MFDTYFDDWEVKPEFSKEYISLWSNWLGEENLHLLDEVSEEDWSRFNSLIIVIAKTYNIGLVDCDARLVSFPKNIEDTLSNYSISMNKNASSFSKYIIPDLECVITEEWDYTYILWHKKNGAVEALNPYIIKSGLKRFAD